MKTPTLPTRLTSVFAFLWMLFIAAIALLTLYALFFTAQSHAGTIVAGGVSSGDDRPFGFQKSLTAAYPGQYQQIYRAGFFPGVTRITQIAFREYQGLGDADVAYTLSIGLGVTARTVVAPGTGFATGAATVFNGTTMAHITADTTDFDFTITLETPFLYNPALGSLLLDITMVSATRSPDWNTYGYFAFSSDTDNITRIVNGPTGVVAAPYHGLVTQFTTAPVPEPGVAGLLLAGGAFTLRRRVHRYVPAFLPKGESRRNPAVTR